MPRIACGLLALSLPLAAAAQTESYAFDPFHTIPNFEVEHLGMTKIRGRFDKTAGKFTIDRTARTGSLEMTVQTATINTGDSERGSRPRSRDEHLRTPDFFNVAEFPTITFKSTGVTFSGENPTSITGQLSIIGVTRAFTFQLDSWKCGPNPANKRPMCGGVAVGTLKRSDFGMKYGIPLLGDEVKLFVSFEAYRN